MATNKKGFILYADQKDIFDQLPNEKAGELIKHIFSYVNDESPESKDVLINLAFTPIKQQLKRDLEKWEKQHSQRVEAGKKSAEVRKRNATSVDERSVSSTVNGNVTVNDTVTANEIKKRAFTPPSINEVIEYFKEKEYSEASARKAFEYYSIADWKDSQGNKVKNWKQKMLSVWMKPENKIKPKNNSHLFQS
jgi:hypothetical protein